MSRICGRRVSMISSTFLSCCGERKELVQQPVICLTVFVLGTQQFDCEIQQLEHFVAAFNAFGMVLDVASGQNQRQPDKTESRKSSMEVPYSISNLVRTCWTESSRLHTTSRYFFQQVFQVSWYRGLSVNIRFNKFSHFRFLLFSCSSKGVSVSSKVAIEVFVPQRMVRPKWAVDFPRARGINSSQQSSDKGYNL